MDGEKMIGIVLIWRMKYEQWRKQWRASFVFQPGVNMHREKELCHNVMGVLVVYHTTQLSGRAIRILFYWAKGVIDDFVLLASSFGSLKFQNLQNSFVRFWLLMFFPSFNIFSVRWKWCVCSSPIFLKGWKLRAQDHLLLFLLWLHGYAGIVIL